VKGEKGPALVIGLGKPKEDDDEEMSTKDMHLSDAFDAVKSGDREGFIDAMKKCLLMSDEYEEDGEASGEEG
jgi:hypothetical protein